MSRRVLVVDDNRDIVDSLADVLRLLGHEARTASNGLKALEIAESWLPELIVMDVGMPGLTGYEVAKRVRAAAWGSSPLLVALTGWSRDEDRAHALECGFDSVETKPLDLARLRQILSAIGHSDLDTKRAESAFAPTGRGKIPPERDALQAP
jgi:CheY-like chemotaxis protein